MSTAVASFDEYSGTWL